MSHTAHFIREVGVVCTPVSLGISEQGEAVRRCVQGCSLLISA